MNVNLLAFIKTLELVFYVAMMCLLGYLVATNFSVNAMLYGGFALLVAYFLVVVFLVNRSQIIYKRSQTELDKKVQ